MIELFIAFAAGLISFLSPCVLPLIPGYISYISGSSINELVNKKNVNLMPTFLFTIGFSIVFVIFGAASTFLGQVLLQNSIELRIFAGIVIIVLSLHIIGIINIKFLSFEKRIHTNSNNNFYSPILGSILALASIEETLTRALLLLSFYSLGLAIPFVLSGYLIQRFLIFSKNFKRNINLISKIGGFTLLVTGILILTNQLQTIGFYILRFFPFMQNFG